MLTRNRILFAVVLVACGGIVAVLSIRGDPPRKLKGTFQSSARSEVKPAELAGWIIEGRRDFTVVDMRAHAEFKAGHVRDAVSCGTCHGSKEEGRKDEAFVDLSKKVVLYAQTDADAIVLPRVMLDNPRLMRMTGGYEAWRKEVLAPVSFEGLKDEAALDAAKRREAMRAFFSGEVPTVAAPPVQAEPVRRASPHKAAAAEGC